MNYIFDTGEKGTGSKEAGGDRGELMNSRQEQRGAGFSESRGWRLGGAQATSPPRRPACEDPGRVSGLQGVTGPHSAHFR